MSYGREAEMAIQSRAFRVPTLLCLLPCCANFMNGPRVDARRGPVGG